ncbi:hypothetical protein, partial [Nocardia sp. NPDC058666]|uniref:hypothetical protein n=1 Tax=Nocardia sp. NPDC058666 TaxID=3346587 RepID=UPI003647FD48
MLVLVLVLRRENDSFLSQPARDRPRAAFRPVTSSAHIVSLARRPACPRLAFLGDQISSSIPSWKMPFLRPVPIVVSSAMQNMAQDRAGAYTNQSQFRVLSPQLHSSGSAFPDEPVQE